MRFRDGFLGSGSRHQFGVNNTTTARMLIGANPGADTGSAGANQYRQWGGDIADMAMWTRVLTPTEIGNIYTKGLAGKNLATVAAETPAPDTDGDGMPNWWETLRALDPNDNGTIGESAPGAKDGPGGALGDPDGDLRTNLQEYQNHNGQRATNPILADTDGDGAADGQEATAGSNPLVTDTDGDGLTDGAEIKTHLTNPLLKDTDGDGGYRPRGSRQYPHKPTGRQHGLRFRAVDESPIGLMGC